MPAFSFRDLVSKLQINYSADELSHYEYGNGISLNDRKVRDIYRMDHPPNTSAPSPLPDSQVSIGELNGKYAIPVPDRYASFPMQMTIAKVGLYSYNGMAGYDETTGTSVGSLWLDANFYLWENTARVRAIYLKQLTNTTHTYYSTVGPIKYTLRCEIARTNFSSDPGTPAGYYSWWGANTTFSHAHAWGPGFGGWGSYYNTNTGYWHQYWNTNNDWGYAPIERYPYGATNVWDDVYWKAVKWSTGYVGFGKSAISAS